MDKHDAFRRSSVAILFESVDRFGVVGTCERFKIGNRRTLSNWLKGKPMRTSSMERIHEIAEKLNLAAAPVPIQGNAGLSTSGFGQPGGKYVNFLVHYRYAQDGDYVYDENGYIGIVEKIHNDNKQLILRTAHTTSLIMAYEQVPVFLGTIRFFDQNYKPKLNTEKMIFEFETIGDSTGAKS